MFKTNDTPHSHDLPEAIEQLFKGVQTYAGKSDNEFFKLIRNYINGICRAVAYQLHADSCAVFFVDKDGVPETSQQLRMQGASGRLKETLIRSKKDGKIYAPYRTSADAGLTQIAWHCGLARWANTRKEMEALRNPNQVAEHGTGKGDRYAYPGGSLDRIFRNCVMVPIFAPGRVSSPPDAGEIKDILRTTGCCSFQDEELNRHVRFLRNHRVVGLLKAENKQPRFGPDVHQLASDFHGMFSTKGPCPFADDCGLWDGSRCLVTTGIQKLFKCRNLKGTEDKSYEPALMALWQQATSKRFRRPLISLSDSYEWDRVCRPAVDFLIKAWDSTFSNQDVELLVSVAMLLGRVLPWRTIQRASLQGMVLDENEVGSLLINPEDIAGLQSLHLAAERIGSHVEFLLQRLQSDLRHEEQCRIAAVRRQGVVPVRNPISSIKARTKTYASLLHKAIQKHNERWDAEVAAQAQPGNHALFTRHNLGSRLMLENFYNIRDVCGVRLTCDYLSDVTQVVQAIFCLSQKWQILIRKVDSKLEDPEASGYRSVHFDLLVRAKNIVAKRDITLLKRQLKTVLRDQPRRTRHEFNGLNDLIRKNELWFPCEIQIRTAYEDSWAGKSHELVYKLDRSHAPLNKELKDFFTIMSNNLFETDRLSDIVQEQIKEFLAPELGEELRLKTLLRERLPRSPPAETLQTRPFRVEDWPLGYLNFAIECAHELYKQNVRYGGTSQYNHALSVVLQLVQRFGLFPDPRSKENRPPRDMQPASTNRTATSSPPRGTNPDEVSRQVTLFVMALLHDCWMAATDQKTGIIRRAQRWRYWNHTSPAHAVTELINAQCRPVIERYGDLIDIRLLWGRPQKKWVQNLFRFFRNYWRAELGDTQRGDLAEATSDTPDDDVAALTFVKTPAWANMIDLAHEKDRLDVCRLMAALLTERLEELPETPNLHRRRGRFERSLLRLPHPARQPSGHIRRGGHFGSMLYDPSKRGDPTPRRDTHTLV